MTRIYTGIALLGASNFVMWASLDARWMLLACLGLALMWKAPA